ncbi:hypothetical protein KI387_015637 [Taxus chinensis]|uniref:Uncharacterized protein n=1 Tax=Taxus chinensis TaxID=29808 RepID=A0AA38GG83_TAXCH|nr:hypothetical protein KI387_015637 [Taxus chinensis]
MLLGRVLGELSQTVKSNCLNVDSETEEDIVLSELEVTKYNARAMSPPELNLHLESEGEFFNRLLIRRKEQAGHPNSDSGPLSCPCSVSIPFEWEEKPGKPKKHLNPQKSPVALTLPPVIKSNCVSRETSLVANSPRTLSDRLRNILQPKFHIVNFYETSEAKGEEEEEHGKVALDVLHYPEEFAWRSLRHSSPVSIFEGPDSSPSSSSSHSLLSYCSNNHNRSLSSSSARHMQHSVPALLANRLIPVTEMLNAVPVDNSGSFCLKLVPVKGGDVSLPELRRVKSVKGGFSSQNRMNRGSLNRRNSNSSRSVSWGGAEFINEGQPNFVPSPEVKPKHCSAIVDVDNCSDFAAPVVSTSVSTVVESGSCFSNNFSIEPAKSAFSKGRCHGSQGIPRRKKHLEKVNKDFKDSYMDDNGQKKLIDSYGRKFQDVKVQPKKWHLSMVHVCHALCILFVFIYDFSDTAYVLFAEL